MVDLDSLSYFDKTDNRLLLKSQKKLLNDLTYTNYSIKPNDVLLAAEKQSEKNGYSVDRNKNRLQSILDRHRIINPVSRNFSLNWCNNGSECGNVGVLLYPLRDSLLMGSYNPKEEILVEIDFRMGELALLANYLNLENIQARLKSDDFWQVKDKELRQKAKVATLSSIYQNPFNSQHSILEDSEFNKILDMRKGFDYKNKPYILHHDAYFTPYYMVSADKAFPKSLRITLYIMLLELLHGLDLKVDFTVVWSMFTETVIKINKSDYDLVTEVLNKTATSLKFCPELDIKICNLSESDSIIKYNNLKGNKMLGKFKVKGYEVKEFGEVELVSALNKDGLISNVQEQQDGDEVKFYIVKGLSRIEVSKDSILSKVKEDVVGKTLQEASNNKVFKFLLENDGIKNIELEAPELIDSIF